MKNRSAGHSRKPAKPANWKVTEEFLSELGALSRKHGIWVSGCGCCGSPFLVEEDAPGYYRRPRWRRLGCRATRGDEDCDIEYETTLIEENRERVEERLRKMGVAV